MWLLPVIICLLASCASTFLPILTYKFPSGNTLSFNVLGFLEPDVFSRILSTYTGSFVVDINSTTVVILTIVAILALPSAFVGVITMSLQRPNRWQFVLALVGIIGTAVPSVLIVLAVILSKNYFPGTFTMGVYPIITPIAMTLCMIVVTRKHKKTLAELRAAEKSKGLIRKGGDL